MIKSPLSEDSLKWACRRIEDFYAVHELDETHQAEAAVGTLRRSLGISDAAIAEFDQWCRAYLDEGESVGLLTLGLMIGLIAADQENGP